VAVGRTVCEEYATLDSLHKIKSGVDRVLLVEPSRASTPTYQIECERHKAALLDEVDRLVEKHPAVQSEFCFARRKRGLTEGFDFVEGVVRRPGSDSDHIILSQPRSLLISSSVFSEW
jgi:hypothetical protein